MLALQLNSSAGPGHSHEQRLSLAHRVAAGALAEHGPAALAVGVYGNAAIGLDGPYSDLDMTVITRPDLGHQSGVTTMDGLVVNPAG